MDEHWAAKRVYDWVDWWVFELAVRLAGHWAASMVLPTVDSWESTMAAS